MKTKKDSEQRIQAIASVLELFRKADAIRFDGGVLLHDWLTVKDIQLVIDNPNAVLVEASWSDGDGGEFNEEISLAEIERFATERMNKRTDSINKIHYTNPHGDKSCVELFHLLPVRAYYEQSVLAKQFAVEAMFCDLNLDDLVSLYDELVAASGSSTSLSKTFEKYDLDPWQQFEDLSHSSLVEEMTSFAREFDSSVERPRKFY